MYNIYIHTYVYIYIYTYIYIYNMHTYTHAHLKSTKSGAGGQFLLPECRATASRENIFLICHRHRPVKEQRKPVPVYVAKPLACSSPKCRPIYIYTPVSLATPCATRSVSSPDSRCLNAASLLLLLLVVVVVYIYIYIYTYIYIYIYYV